MFSTTHDPFCESRNQLITVDCGLRGPDLWQPERKEVTEDGTHSGFVPAKSAVRKISEFGILLISIG